MYNYVIPNKKVVIKDDLNKKEFIQLFKNVLYPVKIKDDFTLEIIGEATTQKLSIFNSDYKIILNNPVPFIYNSYNLFEKMQSIGILCYSSKEVDEIVKLYQELFKDCYESFDYYFNLGNLSNKKYPLIIYVIGNSIQAAETNCPGTLMNEDFYNFTIIKYVDLMDMFKWEENI